MRSRKSTMASVEREQVLADFQACTQLDNVETCIEILEQYDWILMDAVQSVMAQAEPPPVIVSPLSYEPLAEESYSSGILSDPIPWRLHTNVSESVQNFDAGSASGPGIGTSFGAGLSFRGAEKRMLHFNVEYRDKIVDVLMPDTEPVAAIKETLSTQLGVPVGKQVLKGWSNRKVTDNCLLRELHLPKENSLFLLTPDHHHTETGTATSCSDNLNRPYNLLITCHDGNKYHQLNLKFPGTKTVEEVKMDVCDIPVRHQEWSGWPVTMEDSMAIGSIGLSYPTHKLELLSNTSTCKEKATTSKEVPMECYVTEPEEDEDSFHDGDIPLFDDSEIFSHEDRVPRRQGSLIPEAVRDETEALEKFTHQFQERYGECHPVFYVGSLDNAIHDALACSAKDRKLLAIYLHHDNSILANVFCSQVLCNEGIVNYLTNNFLTWAWDMSLERNAASLIHMATRQFGSVAANQIRAYRPDNLPVLLIISRSRATNEVVDVIRGDVTVDELMSKLLQDQDEFAHMQQRDILEEAEREMRENIRNEQDVAYQRSLEADKRKREAKEAEEQKQRDFEQKEQKRKAEEDKKRMEEEALKQAIEEALAQEIPSEPPQGCTLVTCTLRIRTPGTEIIQRRFYGRNKLQTVLNFIVSKGYHLTDYKILTTFPRKDLCNLDTNLTLQELKLCPQETLILEERS